MGLGRARLTPGCVPDSIPPRCPGPTTSGPSVNGPVPPVRRLTVMRRTLTLEVLRWLLCAFNAGTLTIEEWQEIR